MKILNIDALVKTTRQVTLHGVTYDVEEIGVQQFIDNLKAAERLEAGGTKQSMSEAFQEAVESIKESIPSMPDEVLGKLKLPAALAILSFIRGEMDPGAAAAPGEAPAPEGDAEKKPS